MGDGQEGLDLGPLEERYEILGEGRDASAGRGYSARRRSDRAEVEITIVRRPQAEDVGSLDHFASDVNQLANSDHPAIAPVVEGVWLGADAFAVARARPRGTPLSEVLSRGPRLDPPRVAVILQQVEEALVWAREKGLVHRVVTPGSVFLRPESNRIAITFGFAPLSLRGAPDERDDAQTVARLAWVMLTGAPYSADASEDTSDLEQELPRRLLDEMMAILRGESGGREPDVPNLIATVAMAGALKEAEIEAALLEADQIERNRELHEAWEAERAELQRVAAEEADRCATEQAEMMSALDAERAEVAEERSAFERRRAELEQAAVELEDARAEAEQRVADLEAMRAELEARLIETESERSAPDVPVGIPIQFADRAPQPDERPAAADDDENEEATDTPGTRALDRKQVALGATALGVVVFATMIVLGSREGVRADLSSNAGVVRSTPVRVPSPSAARSDNPEFLSRSAAGTVAPGSVMIPVPAVDTGAAYPAADASSGGAASGAAGAEARATASSASSSSPARPSTPPSASAGTAPPNRGNAAVASPPPSIPTIDSVAAPPVARTPAAPGTATIPAGDTIRPDSVSDPRVARPALDFLRRIFTGRDTTVRRDTTIPPDTTGRPH